LPPAGIAAGSQEEKALPFKAALYGAGAKAAEEGRGGDHGEAKTFPRGRSKSSHQEIGAFDSGRHPEAPGWRSFQGFGV
jgi:hypothetical protein